MIAHYKGAGALKGEKGDPGERGPEGPQGIQGERGERGNDGYPFLIYKQYDVGIEEFKEEDFPEIGLMFMVHVWEEDKGYPVYRYTGDGTDTPYSIVTYMNTEGIKGEPGPAGADGKDGEQGPAGVDGKDGITYMPTLGTVETAEDGAADVSIDVDEESKEAKFNFVIPKPNEVNYYSPAPIGTVLSFAGSIAPNGYLLCNGQSVAVADYPDLYAVIGNTYGGDTENFNVPNLIDKFIQGSTTSGEEKEAGLPNITGSISNADASQNDQFLTDSTSASVKTAGALAITAYKSRSSMSNGTDSFNSPSGFKFDASKSNAIYGNSDTVQPPALTMVYIIKTFHTNEGTDEGLSDDVVDYVESEIAEVESKIKSEINPTIDISKVFSDGALNIATLCSTYGNGRYVIVGQGTAGNGSATIDIWTLASRAISYIVNVTYSNKTSNTFIGLTYENPTINFETSYLSACNHIAKVCTLA